MVKKDLFGGAIVVAEFPENLIDVSDLRQVPDNQEVFLYPDSDACIIIEILERVPAQDDIEAVKFHFEALAHDNGAISSTIEPPFVMHNARTPSPIILRGSQRIRKFNAVVADDVDMLVALFRLHPGGKGIDLVLSASVPNSPIDAKEEQIASEFNSLVSSLCIIDYGLFC